MLVEVWAAAAGKEKEEEGGGLAAQHLVRRLDACASDFWWRVEEGICRGMVGAGRYASVPLTLRSLLHTRVRVCSLAPVRMVRVSRFLSRVTLFRSP